MPLRSGVMTYIVCKNCGDPIAGKIPTGDEPRRLTCVHCKKTSDFEDSELKRDIVVHDALTKRWKVEGFGAMINRQSDSARRTPIRRRTGR